MRIPIIALLSSFASVSFAATTQPAETPTALADRVYRWQLHALPTEKTFGKDEPNGWIRAPFYDGAMTLYETAAEPGLLHSTLQLGADLKYELLTRTAKEARPSFLPPLDEKAGKEPYTRFADDLAVGQFYEDCYLERHDDTMIAPLRARLDEIISHPIPGREEWWWCDSLYMAPPVFVRMSQITGDRKYLDYADRQFWDVNTFLYSKKDHLYFRDASYFDKKEANGQPVFWSRGNGWVLAGLVRMLETMPADYPSRDRYVSLFKEMSEKIATLQQPDGSWHVSLLDPRAYDHPETSGTGFYCYALAWGINNGLLPKDRFQPIVEKAWTSISAAVDPKTGKVSAVQKPGVAPAAFQPDDTAEYGSGAVLLAATEIIKLRVAEAGEVRQPVVHEPSIVLTPPQIDKLKSLVRDDPDAKARFATIQAVADGALDDSPNPIRFIRSEGKLKSDPDNQKTAQSMIDMHKVEALAYAALITGDEKYTRKCRDYLIAWATTNISRGDPIDDTNLDHLIFAYDLTCPQLADADRIIIESYLRRVYEIEHQTYTTPSHININNWNSHRLKIQGLIAFALDDRSLIDPIVAAYHKQIEVNLKADGSSIDFEERDALHYHDYDISPLLVLARAARNHGIDLYTYTSPSGASLAKSLAWYIPFEDGSKSHPEFVHSTVEFDRQRAAAGQEEYRAGHIWEPRQGVEALEDGMAFKSELDDLIVKITKSDAKRFATWTSVVNAAGR